MGSDTLQLKPFQKARWDLFSLSIYISKQNHFFLKKKKKNKKEEKKKRTLATIPRRERHLIEGTQKAVGLTSNCTSIASRQPDADPELRMNVSCQVPKALL